MSPPEEESFKNEEVTNNIQYNGVDKYNADWDKPLYLTRKHY